MLWPYILGDSAATDLNRIRGESPEEDSKTHARRPSCRFR